MILLDLMMPGMSGLEVCERLRGDAETAGIPVISVSPVGQVGGTERARALVADVFLAKPIQPAQVLERGLADLHALDARRRAHRGPVFSGMQDELAAPSRDTEADPGGVILPLRDAHCSRRFSGNLTAEPGGQVARAVSCREALGSPHPRSEGILVRLSDPVSHVRRRYRGAPRPCQHRALMLHKADVSPEGVHVTRV